MCIVKYTLITFTSYNHGVEGDERSLKSLVFIRIYEFPMLFYKSPSNIWFLLYKWYVISEKSYETVKEYIKRYAKSVF